MKKMMVLLFLLLSVNLFGVDIISADFGLELGWLPQGTLRMYEVGNKYDLSNTFYVVMSERTNILDYFFIGGSIDVSMHNVGATFSTEGIDYMFETGFQFGMLEIFYKHNCIHPAPTWLYYRMFKFNPLWEAAHDRIGLKITGRMR